MTIADDLAKSPSLPDNWTPMYKGRHPTEQGGYFIIDWTYPLTLTLASGRNVTFNSYAAHSRFVKEDCDYFHKQGKKHHAVL